MKNKQFTKDDLKVGYVVMLKASRKPHIVAMNAAGDMGFVDKDHQWMKLHEYDNLLGDKYPDIGSDYSVMEVYGYSKHITGAYDFSTNDRELLWKRVEAKKMTVEEIEKELGYKIEIVS